MELLKRTLVLYYTSIKGLQATSVVLMSGVIEYAHCPATLKHCVLVWVGETLAFNHVSSRGQTVRSL